MKDENVLKNSYINQKKRQEKNSQQRRHQSSCKSTQKFQRQIKVNRNEIYCTAYIVHAQATQTRYVLRLQTPHIRVDSAL